MPAVGRRNTDAVSPARRAAMLFLDEGRNTREMADELGIARTRISQEVSRLRDERGLAHPGRRGGVPAKPTSLQHELGERDRQDGWLTCCQSADHHRFDCPARPSGGPYLPVAPMTARQLVERVRRDRIVVDEPQPGTMRVRAARCAP